MALVAAGLVLTVSAPAQAATHLVTGQVFRDFNSNGVRDTNAVATGIASDTGLGGVTVTATDAKGIVVGTATTAANGNYTLSVVNPFTTDVRIDFTGLPAGYESSFHGADSGTSVQFVKVAVAPLAVDYAVNAPEDYSQSVAAPLVTAIHGAGLRTHASNATKPSLVSIPWSTPRNDTPTAGDYSTRTTLGLLKDTGTLWGGAFQKTTGDLFATATLRRHADLGPLGLGGIYWVEDALKADGTINASAAMASPWLDVADPLGLNIDVGTIPDSATRGLGGPAQTTRDTEAYSKVGKVGIGGSAVSSDGKLLYFVNLFDKKLYAITIADKTLKASYDLDLAADERPWAVTVHRGKVYIGFVETGEGVTPAPAASTLDMVVRSAPESDLEELANTDDIASTGKEVLRSNLGYTRGDAYGTGVNARFKTWHAWTDVWDATQYTFVNWPGTSWAQASLTDLQFTTQGDLIVGLQDRFGYQSGNRNIDPTGPSNSLYEAVSLGDILMAGPNSTGGFTLENNGVVSGRTGVGAANEGPGGKEFFNDANVYGGTVHHEAVLGGLSTLAGIDQVAATAYDPTSQLRTSGNTWFSTINGSVAKGYQQSPDGGTPPNTNGNFQKAGGIGDIQVLANLAPLEIGNRVWFDADQDGVQDADEPAIDGVKVELFAADVDGNPTGPALDSTTTTNGGEYYFDVDPNQSYVVVFTPPTSGNWVTNDPVFGTVPWADLEFTKKLPGGNASTDSNVNASGEAVVETGDPGQNDHTIDAGLIANASFTVNKVVDTSGGDAAAGQEFTIAADAKDFRGDAYALTQSSVTLEEGETSVAIEVPVGTMVRLVEDDASDYESVTITAPAGATKVGDYYRVQGNTPAFAFRVTNKLFKPGGFEVTKAVTGDFDLSDPELADTEITVRYTYAGSAGFLILNQANDWSDAVDGLPYGAVVTLTETVISGQGPSVDFDTPIWKVGNAAATSGISTQLTIGNATTAEVLLTNPSTELTGGFDLTKSVTGDGASRVPAGFEFVAEYSINGGTTWTELDPMTKADPDVDGPTALPVGTKVLIREQAPDDLDDVEWVSAVFSGTGVTPAAGATPASFVISAAGPIAVTLTNTTSKLDGQFKLTKDVTGPGENLLEVGHEFTVNWELNGDPQTPIVLTNGDFFTSVPLPTGSKVKITEVTPTGGLPAGATWGTPTLTLDGTPAANGATFTIGDATTVDIVLKNPTDVEPSVEITKGDGDAAAGTIKNEADTVTDGEFYKPGETRDIVFKVENTGPEPLRKVVLTDVTRSGGEITDLKWTFPGGSVVAADWDAATSTWSARWDATFAPGITEWAVGDVITGTAKLTADAADKPHQNRVKVDAEGAFSGKPVDDSNDYNAFTAAIQVIKYDGNKADPVVKDGNGDWIIPGKPLADPAQDANDKDHSVPYVADQSNKVRWVVTNTGPTSLTRITLADVTGAGPSIGADWTANLSAFGGPADYSFVKDGPWNGILPPGASFFARGTLTLSADTAHNDTVTVTGVPIVPATNLDGTPSDDPLLDPSGHPVVVLDGNGDPVVLTDDDPFHAHTPKPTPPSGVSPDDEVDSAPDDGNVSPDEDGLLPDAGSGLGAWVPWGGLLLLIVGGGAVFISKRRTTPAGQGKYRA